MLEGDDLTPFLQQYTGVREELARFSIYNITQELIEQKQQGVVFQNMGGQTVIIFCGETREELEERENRALAEVREHIDAYAHQVLDSGAFFRDEALWVDGGHSEDVEGLKELACARMAFLDEQMKDPLTYLDLEDYEE